VEETFTSWRHPEGERPEKARPVQPPDAVEFARTRLGFEPDEKQREILLSSAKRGILNCTRQWGKSTIAAVKAVHRAYTQPRSLVLVASPSERQSGEFVRKASEMVIRLGIKPRGDGDNKVSLKFPNESRIVGLPGMDGTVRGYSNVSLLMIDEASRVGENVFSALTPGLATSGGDLWLMSTPFRKLGRFYQTWQCGGPAWHKVMVPATECPRISREFLEEERLSQRGNFGMEFLCEFQEDGYSVFSRDLVEQALDSTVKPLVVPPMKTWE